MRDHELSMEMHELYMEMQGVCIWHVSCTLCPAKISFLTSAQKKDWGRGLSIRGVWTMQGVGVWRDYAGCRCVTWLCRCVTSLVHTYVCDVTSPHFLLTAFKMPVWESFMNSYQPHNEFVSAAQWTLNPKPFMNSHQPQNESSMRQVDVWHDSCQVT